MTASSDLNQRPAFGGPSSPPTARRLFRSSSNRVFAGVCGGIADYFGAGASAVRLLAVLIALFTAVIPMLLLYLVAAVVVPQGPVGGSAAGSSRPGVDVSARQGSLVIGIALIGLGAGALFNQYFRIDWDALWPLGIVGLGGALVLAAGRR